MGGFQVVVVYILLLLLHNVIIEINSYVLCLACG